MLNGKTEVPSQRPADQVEAGPQAANEMPPGPSDKDIGPLADVRISTVPIPTVAQMVAVPAGDLEPEAPPHTQIERRGLFYQLPPGFNLRHVIHSHFTQSTPAVRAEVETQVGALLCREPDQADMFPEAGLLYRLGHSYQGIRTAEIARMLPRVDDDVRAMLDAFSSIFWRNFLVKVAWRRGNQLASTLLIFAGAYWLALNLHQLEFVDGSFSVISSYLLALPGVFYPGLLVGFLGALAAYSASFGVAMLLYWFLNRWVEDSFQSATQTSCTVIGQNILDRLNALEICVKEINVQIRDYFDHDEAVWTKESSYLMTLLVWIPLRSLHVESYFQLVMWRIRRHVFLVQWLGAFLALAVSILCIWSAWFLLPAFVVGGQAGLVVFAGFAVYLAARSFFGSQTGMNFVQDHIPIGNWRTFGKIRMHQNIVGVVGFLISQFVMVRDYGGRGAKNPGAR